MKIVAYIVLVLAAIHAIGSVVSHTPGKLIFSALIAAVGVVLLMVAKRKKPTA